MAHLKICPHCSLASPSETPVCRCGASLVTVPAIVVPPAPSVATHGPPAATTRESNNLSPAATTREAASVSAAATRREDSRAPAAATRRESSPGSTGSLVRLPAALANRFEVLRELPTRGNEADLLAAFDYTDSMHVVIKLYRAGIEPKLEVLQLLSNLDARHVIRQLQHGSSEGRYYEVMEFAAEGSLADLLRRYDAALPEALVLQMIGQIAAALDYLHSQTPPVVHRDLKPDNLLVRQVDPLSLVLTDFGISSLVEGGSRIAGSVHRTILYAAPEAMVGDISPAMDWWSLGMIIAEAAGGRHPFSGISEQAIAIHCSNRRPVPLETIRQDRLKLLCQGLLAYDQKQRWRLNEVQRWLKGDASLRAPIEPQAAVEAPTVAGNRAARPYRLADHECWTAHDLALAMCEHWDDAVKRVARRVDVERWLTHELGDQNLLNTFLDITEIPDISPEMLLITFLQVLLPEAVPAGVNVAELQADVLKTCLQAAAGMPERMRALAEMLLAGEVLPVDRKEAERLMRLAASKGDEEALKAVREIDLFNAMVLAAKAGDAEEQYKLGMMYYEGDGVCEDDVEAFKWFKKSAESGHMLAQNKLGVMYFGGHSVEKDDNEALKWFNKSAEQGYSDAQNNLGIMIYHGICTEQNHVEGIRLFKMAAEQGNAESQANLGEMYYLGEIVDQNDGEALNWLTQSADQGHAKGQTYLGLMYYEGRCWKKNYTEAASLFIKGAEQGYVLGQYWTGRAYSKGEGVSKNDKEAVKWYKRAAEQGHSLAQFNLAVMYNDGLGVSQDYAEAVKWYKMSADQGYADAQYNLAIMYSDGLGVSQDYAEAVKWFKLAADQGDSDAQYGLGISYIAGLGTTQNRAKGVKWLSKAAGQGHEQAQYQLGKMYGEGSGTGKNEVEAAKWFKMAAEQGNMISQEQLGAMYYLGEGVAQSHEEAFSWYKNAAEQGSMSAQYRIAEMYRDALGVIQNFDEPVTWYRKAAGQGHKEAKKDLEMMLRERPGLSQKDDQDTVEQTRRPDYLKPNNLSIGTKKAFTVRGVTFDMMYIPAGEYLRGSPENEPERDSDETQHRVSISKGFWMGETAVTQGLWQAVMGNNPSHFITCGSNCPVESVSWNDSQEFIKRLNWLVSGGGFRLPTEAEWEYVARAGTTGPYAGDLNAMAWYRGNSADRYIDAQAHPVAEKRPNGWGLYDMHGNIWEWTGDWFGIYPTEFVTDPTGPASGAYRVGRGGSWINSARDCRSASRSRFTPDYRDYVIGLRLARTH